MPREALIGDGFGDVGVTFVSETAANTNSFDYYLLDDFGNFTGIGFVFPELDETSLAPGSEVSLGVLDRGQHYGYFLLEDGYAENPEIRQQGTGLNDQLAFIDLRTGAPGRVVNDGPLMLAIENPDGTFSPLEGDVFHAAIYSFSPDGNILYPGGMVQTLHGFDDKDRFLFAFEDRARNLAGSDDDFNDAVFQLNFGPSDDSTLSSLQVEDELI